MLTSAEWEELRTSARHNVETDRRRRDPDLRLSHIDAAALRAADTWRGGGRVAAWDWRAVTKRTRDAKFEVAIWHADRLCGLALGPVEGLIGMGRACLEYIEGAPPPHPLQGQVIPLAIVTVEEMARIAGLGEVRVLGAIPPLVPLYKRSGMRPWRGRGPRGMSYPRKRMPPL